jgi:hypothetical protein
MPTAAVAPAPWPASADPPADREGQPSFDGGAGTQEQQHRRADGLAERPGERFGVGLHLRAVERGPRAERRRGDRIGLVVHDDERAVVVPEEEVDVALEHRPSGRSVPT